MQIIAGKRAERSADQIERFTWLTYASGRSDHLLCFAPEPLRCRLAQAGQAQGADEERVVAVGGDTGRDLVLSAQEAVGYGLVDGVLDSRTKDRVA